MEKGKDYPIIDGPGYFELCESLRYSATSRHYDHRVRFAFKNPPESHVEGYFFLGVETLAGKSSEQFWVEGTAYDPFYAQGKYIKVAYDPFRKNGSACVVAK